MLYSLLGTRNRFEMIGPTIRNVRFAMRNDNESASLPSGADLVWWLRWQPSVAPGLGPEPSGAVGAGRCQPPEVAK